MSIKGAGAATGEQDQQGGMVPKLRFPEFRDAREWNPVPLSETTQPIKEKVGGVNLTPVSITAGLGFVSQASKFGRDISGDQYKNYTHLRFGDFAYNKGNSKKFPQGYVCQLKEFAEAAVSSAFICFRLKPGHEPTFFQAAFDQNLHGRQLAKYITSGARSDGLLNIRPDAFYSVNIPIPPTPAEQKKIADCLSSIDTLIAAEAEKLEALKDHKKGLMQQLFPAPGETTPRLRFPEFQSAGDWHDKPLSAVCEMKAGKFVAAADISEQPKEGLYPCYGGNGLRGYTRTYTHSGKLSLIGRQGALCGNVNFVTGEFHATEHAIVTKPKAGILGDWLYHALVRLNLNDFATGQAQPGLSVDALEKISCPVPQDEQEQQLIASCLSSVDDLIAAQVDRVAALKVHKNGLMEQLFPSQEKTEA